MNNKERNATLKRCALKIFNSDEESEKAFKAYKESGESQQDFFTKAAIEALSLDIKPTNKYAEVEAVQIRLDGTIHSMLKSMSKKLNIPMERLIIKAINNRIN